MLALHPDPNVIPHLAQHGIADFLLVWEHFCRLRRHDRVPGLLGLAPAGRSPFTLDQVRYLGMMVTAFTLIWLYLFWAQFFVIWFGNMPQESEPLWWQIYGHYGPFFWTMMAGFLAVVMFLAKRWPRYPRWEMALGPIPRTD